MRRLIKQELDIHSPHSELASFDIRSLLSHISMSKKTEDTMYNSVHNMKKKIKIKTEHIKKDTKKKHKKEKKYQQTTHSICSSTETPNFINKLSIDWVNAISSLTIISGNG
jgi:hypothetical protein